MQVLREKKAKNEQGKSVCETHPFLWLLFILFPTKRDQTHQRGGGGVKFKGENRNVGQKCQQILARKEWSANNLLRLDEPFVSPSPTDVTSTSHFCASYFFVWCFLSRGLKTSVCSYITSCAPCHSNDNILICIF